MLSDNFRFAGENEKMILEKSCGAIVYTVENEEIKYLLVEETSGGHSFPKGHMNLVLFGPMR